jgi:hypothetical protein
MREQDQREQEQRDQEEQWTEKVQKLEEESVKGRASFYSLT